MNMDNITITGNGEELVRAIGEESRVRVDTVTAKAENDIRGLSNSAEEELEKFRTAIAAETDERIARQTRILKNRMALESKKLKMRVMDEYADEILAVVMDELRNKFKKTYVEFIETAFNEGIETCMKYHCDMVRIHVNPEDAELVGSMVKKLSEDSERHLNLQVQPDDDIGAGILLEPDKEGILFNYTLERVLFRKRKDIRRLFHRFLMEKAEGDMLKAAVYE